MTNTTIPNRYSGYRYDAPATIALADVNTPGAIMAYLAAEREPAERCTGGSWSFDTFYDCHGCSRGCCAYMTLGRNLAQAGKLAATEPHRPALESALAAAEALRGVGRAIEAALRPGLALTALALHCIQTFDTIVKGRWVEVVGNGKRGKAAAHIGKRGEVVWVGGGEERRSRYDTWSYGRDAVRVGVKFEDMTREDKPVYLNYAHVRAIVTPAPVQVARKAAEYRKADAAARAAVRPEFYGGRGACVVLADGRVGDVFWRGPSKRAGECDRVGVKFCGCRKRCAHETLWLAVTDVANVAVTYPVCYEREVKTADGETVTITSEDLFVQLVEALVAAGAESHAQAWLADRERILAAAQREREDQAERKADEAAYRSLTKRGAGGSLPLSPAVQS